MKDILFHSHNGFFLLFFSLVVQKYSIKFWWRNIDSQAQVRVNSQTHNKTTVSLCHAVSFCLALRYLHAKSQLHSSRFPWDIAKISQICYFGFIGHAWLFTSKVILSTCRKLLSLSAYKKLTSSPCFSGHIANFWTYCLASHIHNDSINL